ACSPWLIFRSGCRAGGSHYGASSVPEYDGRVSAPKDAHRGTQIPKRHAIHRHGQPVAARHAGSNQTSNASQRINSCAMRVGIDFGTTHTVVAVVDRGNFPVVSFDGIDTWPSIVAANAAGELRFGLD